MARSHLITIKVLGDGGIILMKGFFLQEGTSPSTIKAKMAEAGINVHISSQTSTRTDFERNKLPKEVVRASVHYYNTEEELCAFVETLQRLKGS